MKTSYTIYNKLRIKIKSEEDKFIPIVMFGKEVMFDDYASCDANEISSVVNQMKQDLGTGGQKCLKSGPIVTIKDNKATLKSVNELGYRRVIQIVKNGNSIADTKLKY